MWKQTIVSSVDIILRIIRNKKEIKRNKTIKRIILKKLTTI